MTTRLTGLHGPNSCVPGVISTGLVTLDRWMGGGLHPGELIVVAGRPSSGKSAFVLGLATHAALSERVGAVVFSLEAVTERIAHRLISATAQADGTRLRLCYLSERDWRSIARAAMRLAHAPLFLDIAPELTAFEVGSKARRLMAERPLGLVVIDCLKLMKRTWREKEIGGILRGLKTLARQLALPLVVVSRADGPVEPCRDERPGLWNLQDADEIYKTADVVLILHRPAVERARAGRRVNPDEAGDAEVLIAKQRNGPTGIVRLEFVDRFTRFLDVAP